MKREHRLCDAEASEGKIDSAEKNAQYPIRSEKEKLLVQNLFNARSDGLYLQKYFS